MKISSKSKDRTGKKKSKRSKRRRESSTSSYSSSDSDDRSLPPQKRAFKKRRRSPSPADDDNWKKGKKKYEKKKSRNGRRRRRLRRRSFSSSSRSCSTCDPSYSDSDRSPSPISKKSKLAKRGRPRDRDLERKNSLAKRRKASRSCSTCSDHTSHSDSGRSRRSPSRQKLRNKKLCDEEKTKDFKADDGFPQIDTSDTKNNGKAEKKIMKDIVDDLKLEAKEASSKIELSETDAHGASDYGSLKEASLGKKNEVVHDTGSDSLEAEKLEMVLKFKALENFKKYLGGNKKSESFKVAEQSIEIGEVHHGTADVAFSPRSSNIGPNGAANTTTRNWTPRLSSVVIRPETNEGSPERGASDNETSQPASREDHSGYRKELCTENHSNISRLSSKVVPNNNNDMLSTREVSRKAPESVNKCINEARNDHVCGDDSNISVGSKTMTAPATKMDMPSSTSNEPADGSQFQHKTLSRTHDGEMVKVSYKVYIPKNSPALARRKLQR